MSNRRPLMLLALGFLGSLVSTGTAWAHGAHIQYQSTQAIEIQATFDSGEPMQQAQVVVYSPENPSEPWAQGITDDQGRYVFTPDLSIPGNWEVAVRQAGHGDIATIPVAEATSSNDLPQSSNGAQASAPTASGKLSPIQQGITIGAVIWGFVGTALFFSRGKR